MSEEELKAMIDEFDTDNDGESMSVSFPHPLSIFTSLSLSISFFLSPSIHLSSLLSFSHLYLSPDSNYYPLIPVSFCV